MDAKSDNIKSKMENVNANFKSRGESAEVIKNGHNGQSLPAVDGIFSKKPDPVNLPLSPHPHAEVYKKYARRGLAIIFNHKYFNIDFCATRDGTDKDRDDLQSVLQELKFDVKIYNDLTYEETMNVLNVVSKMDHTDSDCLIIAVMSHGDEGIIYAKDASYPTNKLWKKFSPLHCPSLAGKPKLFFIQACRGDKTDPGTQVSYVQKDSEKISDGVYSIPLMADILVMYATVEGYYAWRDRTNGSYFIQALVNQLRNHHESKDLLSILTCVNRQVAIGFTSTEPNYPEFNRKKEMCSIVSMLTRLYYFNL